MLFKLSLKNIKKSIKDYSIYFFTLVFAVAMFYMFNSIDAQESMLELNSAKSDLIKSLVFIIGYISVFVSVILGFLIVYSNNFLIRKRKKEIGLYFTLGMSKRKVSWILVVETVIIGLFSLIIGLLFGIFLSQFISILTAKLFEVNMNNFKFIFSTAAFTKTLIYFGLIFVLVMIFNVITLSRYKLIDLLNASKKNEKVKFRNKFITLITFILSIVLIGYAYNLLLNKHSLLMMNQDTLIMILCGALGTFFLFFSLSGFLLKVFEHIKSVYYRGLNMFALKQINSKINTTVISTTIISLMLLLTIGILSGSMSMASLFNDDLKENNLTDYTVNLFYTTYEVEEDGEYKELDKNYKGGEELNKSEEFKKYSTESVFFYRYNYDDLVTSSMMTKESIKKLQKEYGSTVSLDFKVDIMSETDYKNIMNLIGKDYIDIKNNEYLLLANVEMITDAYAPYYRSKKGIEINGTKLTPATDEIIETALINNNSPGNDGVVVVSDEIAKTLEKSTASIIGNYIDTNDIETIEKEFRQYIDTQELGIGGVNLRTKIDMEASSIGLKAILIFLGLYLGITFAITSATVLAIGQLSEASDNKNRYRILRQIGADNKMLNKALLIQIGVTFMFPLVIALIHSFVGLKEINNLILAMGKVDLTSNIFLTTLFILIVYGGYFLITYICSKNVIKEK